MLSFHLTLYVLLGGTVSGGLCLGGLVGGPQGEVVAEELHDEGGVLVRLLRQSVELGDGIVEGLLGDVAGAVGAVEDLVVEDGEVEGKAEADGVGGGKVGGGNAGGSLVGIEGSRSGSLAGGTGLELGEVTVVVTLHLVVEDLGLLGGGVGDKRLLDDAEDVIADVDELGLDLGLVVLDDGHLVGIALLLDGGDDAPGRTAGADDVLVGDGEEVALLDGELLGLLGNLLHVGNHLIEALGLLGELGLVHQGIAIHLVIYLFIYLFGEMRNICWCSRYRRFMCTFVCE